MLGVFLGNGLPQVKAEESAFQKYYTVEKLEEIKISRVNFEDTEFWNKHLLFDFTEYYETNDYETNDRL